MPQGGTYDTCIQVSPPRIQSHQLLQAPPVQPQSPFLFPLAVSSPLQTGHLGQHVFCCAWTYGVMHCDIHSSSLPRPPKESQPRGWEVGRGSPFLSCKEAPFLSSESPLNHLPFLSSESRLQACLCRAQPLQQEGLVGFAIPFIQIQGTLSPYIQPV